MIDRDLRDFIVLLDVHLAARNLSSVLYLSGGAAVVLCYGGAEKTKDVDAVGPKDAALEALEAFAGRNSEVHRKTGLYFECVPPLYAAAGGIPGALAERAAAVELGIELKAIELRALEIHDLIVSKIRRLGAKDREDIRLLTQHPDFDADTLIDRYAQAREWTRMDEALLEQDDANFNSILTAVLGLQAREW